MWTSPRVNLDCAEINHTGIDDFCSCSFCKAAVFLKVGEEKFAFTTFSSRLIFQNSEFIYSRSLFLSIFFQFKVIFNYAPFNRIKFKYFEKEWFVLHNCRWWFLKPEVRHLFNLIIACCRNVNYLRHVLIVNLVKGRGQ